MRKIVVIAAAALIVILGGCGNLGEEPVPYPGPNADGSVTLFVNGSLYNFDYTAAYDGIQLEGYQALKPDPDRPGESLGGPFTALSSKTGGSFSGGSGRIAVATLAEQPTAEIRKSRYANKGSRAMEFSHHKRGNGAAVEGETWIISLFDDPLLVANNFKSVSWWAKYGEWPDLSVVGTVGQAAVKITIIGESGTTIGEGTASILNWQRDSNWYRYSFTLMPPAYLRADERIRKWKINFPPNAGQAWVDEIVLEK